jgi:hypothetical protein
MSDLNAANTGTPLNRLKTDMRVFGERVAARFPVRLIVLIAGIVAIVYGQYLMEQRFPQGAPSLDAELWNITYRLDIPNYDNAYKALPYLIVGAFLCALTVMPSSWKHPFKNWSVKESSYQDIRVQSLTIVIGSLLFVFLLIQLGKHLYTPIYLILWFISILAFTRVFWKMDRGLQRDLSPGISYFDWFCLTGFLFLGFSIGSLALQDLPITIIPDEDQFWQTARAIALGHTYPVIFDSGVFTFPIASSVYQGWALRLFGATLWGWRFSSVIAGVLVVIPLYLLTREWFGRNVAITACLLMLANPYFLSFARLGYNNSQSLLPVTLCIYFFALATCKGSYFYLWLSGLVAGFGFYTYSATWLGPVVMGFGILYLWLLKEFNWKQTLMIIGILLLGWGITFLPRVAYVMSGDHPQGLVDKIFETIFANPFYGLVYYGEADLINTMPLLHIGEDYTLFYDPVIYGELIFRGAIRTFLAIFDPYIISNHFLFSGLAGVVTPVFFLIGLAVSLRHRNQRRFGLLVIWFFAGMIFLSVISAFPPSQGQLVPIIPVLALLSAVGLVAVTESFMELLFKHYALLQISVRNILIAVAALAILALGLQRYFIIMPTTYRPTFENIPLWIARRIETPVSIVYLGPPRKAARIGQLLNTAGVSHQYTPVVINNFSPETRLTKAPNITFIESGQAPEFAFLQKPPAGYHQPVAYYDEDGQIIGYAITNTNIDLKPNLGIGEGIRSLIEKPVRYVLALLIILFLFFGFLARRDGLGILADKRKSP